ncbi:hypothetical protein [Paludisphaera soli]|uniref:hypothetical protein n=1 Tax=Paludisphaera soli TaxID=2712865 RepID=UPI0013E9BB0A|nr:hypothetical protein [Paludisphaera soli]
MRIAGLILIALGALMTITRVAAIVLRQAPLSPHESSKMLGAVGFSALVLVAGLLLLQRSRGNPSG